jgi:hypothetical protein
MANEEHLAILRRRVKVWNAWREENPDVQPGLGCAAWARRSKPNWCKAARCESIYSNSTRC